MAERVLEASGLVKRYKRTTAVGGVSLGVEAGERVALLGANGAGKTTTLLMLLGAITPDDGSVTVLGHRLPGGRSRAMEDVGFAAGYLPLPDRLRVKEVLAYFAHLHGVAEPGPAIEAGLERFRIPHLAEAMAGELSSGQRTLVGIIKATLHRPGCWCSTSPPPPSTPTWPTGCGWGWRRRATRPARRCW
jgi:ABC-2 type transport system ATP-binding protein